MHVESYRDISLSAKTVGELPKMTEWPENLVLDAAGPELPKRDQGEQATHATRVTPKS